MQRFCDGLLEIAASAAKVRRNRERDADTDQRLAAAGRLTLRLWEHEDPVNGAAAVEEAVRARRTRPGERDVG